MSMATMMTMSRDCPSDVVIEGDCLDVLATLPDACVDAIICDPPYGTTACRWDAVIPFAPLWAQLHRVLKPQRAIALFSSQPFTSALVASNIARFRYEWIWRKSVGGGFLTAKHRPLKRHENIVVFSEGEHLYHPQLRRGEAYHARQGYAGEALARRGDEIAGWVTKNPGFRYPTSVLTFASETGLHPTQKPVALIRYLVRTYSDPGDLILDFTLGSGTTALAAALEGRHYLGIERETKYVRAARRRLAQTLTPQIRPRSARPARRVTSRE